MTSLKMANKILQNISALQILTPNIIQLPWWRPFYFSPQLFDFDVEVKPILEVLVGKTTEQALLEVMEEEELANLRSQQRAFQELRNAEYVEQQRLEEEERRHKEEKVSV